jgi:hypothetical protein
MSNAIKGMLCSALIFPGAGQIILAKYYRGLTFFVVAFVSGILFLTAVVRQAVVRLQDTVAQGVVVDVSKVMSILTEPSTYASSVYLKLSFLVLFCCWLFSVVDAWRLGKKLDQKPSDI